MNKQQRQKDALDYTRDYFNLPAEEELYYAEMKILGDFWSITTNNKNAIKEEMKSFSEIKRELEGLR